MTLQKQQIDQPVVKPHHKTENMADLHEATIAPPSRWPSLDVRELFAYRELLYFFIWRDIKVRYKQTALGIAWAVMQPLLTMILFSVFFGWLARMPSDGIPYPVFAYIALVPWTYFANAFTQASNSLVEHERMITKIYFPRLLVPLAPVLAGLVDFVIAFTILIGLMFWYGIVPEPTIWAIPLFMVMAAVTALSVSLWLAALNVQYRDIRYVVPFLIQFWLFATPIVYPSSLVPEQWRPLYGLNPMAGVVEGFRWALLGQAEAPGAMLVVSILTVVLILIGGIYYFRHMEEIFADVV